MPMKLSRTITILTAIASGLYAPAQTTTDSLVIDGQHYISWDTSDTIPLLPAGPEARLSERDYAEVAEELGVETAAIKAVVDIEAGKGHKGFWSEGKPIINFDLSMYRQAARRAGVDLTKAHRQHPVIFSRPNIRRYGSQQAAQQARLDAAMSIDRRSAIEGTFWGMFQIGGFNWRRCGAESIEGFVEQMASSERGQLELFAEFLKSTGLDKHLRSKNWRAFARGYNGPGYARRGYHTRLANAYARHKSKED